MPPQQIRLADLHRHRPLPIFAGTPARVDVDVAEVESEEADEEAFLAC